MAEQNELQQEEISFGAFEEQLKLRKAVEQVKVLKMEYHREIC